MANTILDSGVISNGDDPGQPFSIDPPSEGAASTFRATRLTVQPSGSDMRWTIDDTPLERAARIAAGESKVFEGADLIDRLTLCFCDTNREASVHVLLESDGTVDARFLLENALKPRGLSRDQLADFVQMVRATPPSGVNPIRGVDAVVNFQHFRSAGTPICSERNPWHEPPPVLLETEADRRRRQRKELREDKK